MRTIKFRGIIKNPDELFSGFIYGDLLHYANGNIGIRQIETGQEFEVDPETVGQFTGLLDKNGKEIFEGDLIKYENKKFEIKYLNARFSAIELSGTECETLGVLLWNDAEIIGNIFNNPELLKN